MNGKWTPSSWTSASTKENTLSGKQMVQTSSSEREGNVFFKATVLFSFVLFPAGIQKMSSQLLRSARDFFHFWTFHSRLIYNVHSLQIVTEQETCLTKHNGSTRPLLTLSGASACLLWGVNSHPEKKKTTEKGEVTDSKGESKLSPIAVLRSTSSLALCPGLYVPGLGS